MKLGIRLCHSLPAVYLATGLALGALIYRGEDRLSQSQVINDLSRNLEFIGLQATHGIRPLLDTRNYPALNRLVSQLRTGPNIRVAALVASDLTVLASSLEATQGQPAGTHPLLSAYASDLRWSAAHKVFANPAEQRVVGIFPCGSGAGDQGEVLLIVADSSLPLAVARDRLAGLWIKSTVALAAAALVGFLTLRHRLGHRLAQLVRLLREGVPQQIPLNIDPGPRDEIGELITEFNKAWLLTAARLADLTKLTEHPIPRQLPHTTPGAPGQSTTEVYRHAIEAADAVPYERSYHPESFTFIGEGIERLTGIPASRMTPQLWSQLTSDSTMLGEGESLTEAQAAERARSGNLRHWRSECRITTPAGETRWIADSSAEVLGPDGKSTGSIGILQDITLHKKAQEQRLAMERQIQETQKLESLGVLAGGIAHDFNNLLTAILSNASLARTELQRGSPIDESLAHIETAAVQAANLCRKMLAYSGRGHFIVSHADINTIIDDMTDILNVGVTRKIVVIREGRTEPCGVNADIQQVQQVILNLVSNATEAIGDTSGRVWLRTAVVDNEIVRGHEGWTTAPPHDGNWVMLEVEDTGCGMDPATRARMFEPFFTTKFSGRGLGMAATLGIVRGHRGFIHVVSRPGEGTRIRVFLPHSPAPSRETPQIPRSPAPDHTAPVRGLLLLVDDQREVRRVIAEMLREIGIEVVEASDGHEGIQLFNQRPGGFSAAILDLNMPRVSGVEACRQLRAIRPDLKILIVSGSSEVEVLRRFDSMERIEVLQKPFRHAEFMFKVRALLSDTTTTTAATV